RTPWETGSTRCCRSSRCRQASRVRASRSTAREMRPCSRPASSAVSGAPMIERYTRREMGQIWSEQRKLEAWLEVEVAVCEVLAERGVIPPCDMEALRGASFKLEAVKERERLTDHDVAAFVDVV